MLSEPIVEPDGARRNEMSPTRLTLDEATLLQMADDAQRHARRLGANHVGIGVSERACVSIETGDGKPESTQQDNTHAFSVNVQAHRRSGSASTNRLTIDAMRDAVERAVAIMTMVETDDTERQPKDEWLARSVANIPLYGDPGPNAGAALNQALAVERQVHDRSAALGVALRHVEASITAQEYRFALNVDGKVAHSGTSSMQTRAALAIVERDGASVRDRWEARDRSSTHFSSDALIAEAAVDRAVRQLGGQSISSRVCAVLFDAAVAAKLVWGLVDALDGFAQFDRATFLPDAIGTRALPDHVSLFEDPLEPWGLASAACDSAGIAAMPRPVIERGTVAGLFVTIPAAYRLGCAPTGHANGPCNLTLTSEQTDMNDNLPAMLRKLGRGLWVTNLSGGRVDPAMGSFSQAVSGQWVEGGQVVHPVVGITIAGNMRDMMTDMLAVGADVHRSGAVRTGSILIEKMQVAGR